MPARIMRQPQGVLPIAELHGVLPACCYQPSVVSRGLSGQAGISATPSIMSLPPIMLPACTKTSSDIQREIIDTA
jgi:hypothetical protein